MGGIVSLSRSNQYLESINHLKSEGWYRSTEPGLEKWATLNREYAAKWPNITVRDMPPADAKEWDGVPGKLSHFSPAPHDAAASEEMAECAREVVK
jgi:hypothetical protein